jgi:hypothetical protein
MNKKKIMMFEIMSGNSGGGGADVSGVTATAPDVDEGKIFVDNTGSQVVGTSTYKADYIALRTDIDNLNDTLEPVLLGDGSDTNVYANVSNVTATASDVATGKVFVDNTGEEVTGTAVDSSAEFIKMIERTNYATITLPNGTTKIGEQAFSRYLYLSGVNIPNTVTSIGNEAFLYCRELSLSSLPTSITTIGNKAFLDCQQLNITSLPDGVTSIGNEAFSNCIRLALTNLPSSLTDINPSAFRGCSSLALTSLPSGVRSIGNTSFYECRGLTTITLPDTLLSIGQSSFGACTGLTTVTFLGTPTSIVSGSYASFNGCTNLTTINVPWSEGTVSGAPWGATNATIVYDYIPS